MFQRGVSEGRFKWGVSEGCFRPLGGSPERFCVMYPGGNFVKIPPPEAQSGEETSTERFPFENQCRRWPRRTCGQLGVFIFRDDVGQTLFPGGCVSEGCFRGVFQRGVSDPLGGSPERFCAMYPGGHFVKIRLPEGSIGQETGTAGFLVRNQCRRWPRRPCGQLGVFSFNEDVGKT